MRGGPQTQHRQPVDPNFFSMGKRSGVCTCREGKVWTHALSLTERVRSPQQGFLTLNFSKFTQKIPFLYSNSPDPDLNKNAIDYRDNHKYRDAINIYTKMQRK